MTEKKQNNSNSIFFLKGEGMNRRYRNIEAIKQLILSGRSYQEIVTKARRYFRSRTIEEYYEIASDEIKNGTREEPFIDYAYRKKREKKRKEKERSNEV